LATGAASYRVPKYKDFVTLEAPTSFRAEIMKEFAKDFGTPPRRLACKTKQSATFIELRKT